MADNDIYNSKSKYEYFKGNIELFLTKPEDRKDKGKSHAKYYCRNSSNLKYFDNSYYKDIKYVYSVEFIKKPSYIAVLKADKVNLKKSNNLIVNLDNTLVVKDINNCKLILYNHFYNVNEDCNLQNNTIIPKEKYKIEEFNSNLFDLLKIFALLFIIYLIYRIIRHYFVIGI